MFPRAAREGGGVTVLDAKGHTPGQLAVEVRSDGEGLLHIVDVAHVPEIHLTRPDWFMAADNWPAWSFATRQLARPASIVPGDDVRGLPRPTRNTCHMMAM